MTRNVSVLMGSVLADELSKHGVWGLTTADCERIAERMVSRTADAAPPVRVRKADVIRPQNDNSAQLRGMPQQVRPMAPMPPLAPAQPSAAWPILAGLLLLLTLLTTAGACAFHDAAPFCVHLASGDVAGACWKRMPSADRSPDSRG
jgi:hypothetical protein